MNAANLILCPNCHKRMMEYETLHCYACGYEDTDLDSHYKKLFDSNYDNVERTTNTIVRGY